MGNRQRWRDPTMLSREQLQDDRAAYAWAAAAVLGAYLALPDSERERVPDGLRWAFDHGMDGFLGDLRLPRSALVAGALETLPEAGRAALAAWEAEQADVWAERQLSTALWPGWADILGDAWEHAWPAIGTEAPTAGGQLQLGEPPQ
jgi:hypothetical protein